MKKQKWTSVRHKMVVEIIRPIFKVLGFFKFNLKVKKEKLPKEGSIIICNHTMALDPFIVGLKFDKPLYYMTSKDLFQNKFLGKLITWLIHPIPKEKSNKGDMQSIRDCVTVSKENGNICIFPEGNRTFSGKLGNVDYSIVKLIKLLKKPLIICNIIGGFASDPRWSHKRRKGKLEIIKRIQLDYADYKDLNNDDLYALIISNLQVNEFNGTLFKGKKKAEYLESILHICPACYQENKLISQDNRIVCRHCNLEVQYTEALTFKTNNEKCKFKYLFEWYDWQIEFIKTKSFLANELIYQDKIEVYEPVINKKKKLIGKGLISLYDDYFLFEFAEMKIKMSFADIKAITLLGRSKMNIYYADKVYQVFNNRRTNLMKYMHTFYIINNRKRGVLDGFIGI